MPLSKGARTSLARVLAHVGAADDAGAPPTPRGGALCLLVCRPVAPSARPPTLSVRGVRVGGGP
eukprot:5020771-Prymnesium_polylepis.1